MFSLPKFKKITLAADLDVFSDTYTRCSGFVVNREYYEANQVFGVYYQGHMIGGFVLGTGDTLRTLQVFAGSENRDNLYDHITKTNLVHTEMCCFWIDPGYHKTTWLNFFVWLCVAYALRVFGSKQLIFGTNSARLAALYSATPKCLLLHRDCIRDKQTFIFTGPRKHCLLGVAQILQYKIKRLGKIARQKSQVKAPLLRSEIRTLTTV